MSDRVGLHKRCYLFYFHIYELSKPGVAARIKYVVFIQVNINICSIDKRRAMQKLLIVWKNLILAKYAPIAYIV